MFLSMLPGWGTQAALTVAWTYGETLELGTADKTFSAVDIGTASGSRIVAVCVKGDGGGGQPTAVTIGGVAGTSIVAANVGTQYNSIWAARVPTGATGDIRVQRSGAPARQGISVYQIHNKPGAAVTASATATDTATAFTQSLAIPAKGVAIGCGVTGNASGSGTWTNLTEDYDANGVDGTLVTASTSSLLGSTPSITFTPSAADSPSMVLASWGP
jgi:hypothetical protein